MDDADTGSGGPPKGGPPASGTPASGPPAAAVRFQRVARRILDALFEADPERATELGVHTWDDRLTDYSAAGVAARSAVLHDALGALDEVDDAGLGDEDRVDLEIARGAIAGEAWELAELRRHEFDPRVHLPADALYPLLARPSGDPAERVRAVTARLAGIPRRLAVARQVLHDMPRVHVETAAEQARGALGLLGGPLDDLLDLVPVPTASTSSTSSTSSAASMDEARTAAAEALTGFAAWLDGQLPGADGDPRLGEQAYAARLWYALDTETTPDALLLHAESDLQAVEEQIAEAAAEVAGSPPRRGQVREVLDRLAAQAPVDDSTVLSVCRQAVEDAARRVRELDLVTLPEADVRVIAMPPARRGLSVAYCDAPGPLEPGAGGGSLPTFFAVSPTPAGWPAERVASFYREYNGHMLRNLAVHEAMPGHVVQLAHAARYRGSTPVRSAFPSDTFVEGWAVYAEQLVAGAGLGLGRAVDDGLRMQMLKVRLRSIINAILDVRVHAHGMTEAEAMSLMTRRGHQEEGEAVGKWRRALLGSAQLATYYVGHREIASLVGRLGRAEPAMTARDRHDAVLAHGCPPPRHLARLLGVSGSG